MHGRSPPTRSPLGGEDDDNLPQHELARLLYARRQQSIAPPRTTVTGKKRDQHSAQLERLRREVVVLTREIDKHTLSRDLLVARRLHRFDDLDGSSVKAVVEYFRVFQRGLILSPVDAIAFLHSIAAEDIRINGFMGRSVWIDQWKTYSMCWDDFDLRLRETKVIPLTDEEATVVTTSTIAVKISRLTLPVMFPHMLQSKRLVKRLLGQKIIVRASQGFAYDRKKKQFVRLTISMGFVGAFAKLLPDPTELETLFSRALFSDGFYIGEVTGTTERPTSDQHTARPRVPSPDLEETKQGSSEPERTQRGDKMRLDHIL